MKNANQGALIIAFYLSKFDAIAYQNLGYETITLTHKAVGNALGVKVTTIQNMRDEFDPHHKNSRKGWWQRNLSRSRQATFNLFSAFSEPQLYNLVKEILSTKKVPASISDELSKIEQKNSLVFTNKTWSSPELAIALDTYLYMLRLQISEIPFTTLHLTNLLLEGPLNGRTRQNLRKKMRHISDIFKKRNLPLVKGYTPVSDFSHQIRREIEILISERAEIISEIIGHKDPVRPSLKDVVSKLEKLELKLNSFETSHIQGLGHNNPPEPITDDALKISEAKESLKILRDLLISESTNQKKINTNKTNLLSFGLRLAIWTGNRITDFSRAAAIAGGTGAAGLWLAGRAPSAFDTMKSLIEALQALN